MINFRKSAVAAAITLASFTGAGCYNHTFVQGNVMPYPMPSMDAMSWSLIYGLINLSGEVHLEQVCPGGVARIQDELDVLDWFISAITGGILTPTHVTVWCAAMPGQANTGNVAPQAKVITIAPTAGQLASFARENANLVAQLQQSRSHQATASATSSQF